MKEKWAVIDDSVSSYCTRSLNLLEMNGPRRAVGVGNVLRIPYRFIRIHRDNIFSLERSCAVCSTCRQESHQKQENARNWFRPSNHCRHRILNCLERSPISARPPYHLLQTDSKFFAFLPNSPVTRIKLNQFYTCVAKGVKLTAFS